jgi:hypothetical protein
MTNNQNLHHALLPEEWKAVSRQVIDKAKGRCEICKHDILDRRLVCHERWCVLPKLRVQRLVGLQAICVACHHAVHYGRAAGIKGVSYRRAFTHICRVNNWSQTKTKAYIARVKRIERSLPHNWIYSVDMSFVERFGVRPMPRHSQDVEDIRAFNAENCVDLVPKIIRLSKSRSIAVFHADSAIVCSRLFIDSNSKPERQRFLRNLPKMNTSRHRLIGIYSRTASQDAVWRDLLAELSRTDASASARSKANC